VILDARASNTTLRLQQVRDLMRAQGVDAVIARSTDRYLNEYVPLSESTRAWLTGFTGSMGDALVGVDAAWLVVDGRYYLQADQEVEGTPLTVERVPLGTSIRTSLFELVKKLARGGAKKIAYEPDRFALKELEELQKLLQGTSATLVATKPSLLEQARGPIEEPERPVRVIDERAVGATIADKVARAKEALAQADVKAFVVQRLDELAWLVNLRGDDFPFQATFRGIGVLTPDAALLAVRAGRLPKEAVARSGLKVIDATDWAAALRPGDRVGYDPDGVTADVVQTIEKRGCKPVAVASPVAALKAKKNDAELAAMKAAFAKADAVVEAAQAFVHARLDAGQVVTEADLAHEVERLFLASGATGLSFKVIAAAGKNGAVIHYGTPDPERKIVAGELVLLDTGGYYAEGYATDLTRTFLAGSKAKATAEQRRYFTLTLKAAIAGMSARLPLSGRGDQLDAITRAPLWAAGLDFNHGTGHGVGINVHEFPPRVSPNAPSVRLEVGHVFSIEPGVYLPDFGGVRIENLCTMALAKDAPGFMDVVPLTSSRYDERLYDDALLTVAEKAWLAGFAKLRDERIRTYGA
jgi:Xaa-Pro aminopeptidase